MEIGKLYNILVDLNISSTDDKLQQNITNLSNYIINNNSEEIDKSLKIIEKLFKSSIVNNLVPSDLEILEKIKGLKFFGDYGYSEITKILTSQTFNTQKVYQELQEYINERQKFLTKLDELEKLFDFFDIEVQYPNDMAHLGILIPEDYSNNTIPNITKELIKWDKVIKTFKELIGEDIDDTKIDYVSNGSLDFFIENSIEIAQIVSSTLLSIVTVYKKVTEIRTKREELKELGIPSSEQKVIEKHEKELITKEIDKISAELIKEFASKQIESGRLNELKISVRNQVLYMAKCVDNGITIEINPPTFDEKEPEQVKEDDTADVKKEKLAKIKEYTQKTKKLEIIEKSMDGIKTIGKLGLDISKYLTSGDGEPENE